MDGQQFDRLAKGFASTLTRRRALRLVLATAAASVAARTGRVEAVFPLCAEDGEGCTLWVRCCGGLVCASSLLNPNAGVCRPGSGASAAADPPPSRPPEDDPPPASEGSFEVEVQCSGDPERTTVRNTGETPITVEQIDSLFEDVPGEPYQPNDTIAPGEEIIYETGEQASGQNVLANRPIYHDDEPSEGVEVKTTAGTVQVLCAEGRSRSGQAVRTSGRRKQRRRRRT